MSFDCIFLQVMNIKFQMAVVTSLQVAVIFCNAIIYLTKLAKVSKAVYNPQCKCAKVKRFSL